MPTRLAAATSPYLLQHADNPVDWHEWGPDAFEKARREEKPVFLSIGYSTCHWCHVMARESFENAEIAAVLNEYFVAIKVDREERPDVDALYMTFVQATTGSGGWPMSVWLTPDATPFFGGTYFPPSDQHGRPGFVTVLERIAELWATDRRNVVAQGDRVLTGLREATQSSASASADAELTTAPLRAGFDAFAGNFDPVHGGFSTSGPKFPRPSVFDFLLRIFHRGEPDTADRALAMTLHTLRAMANGGIHDHLGGGFHRYSVDGQWHVPHFEKMLYDQAQLANSYLDAWQITGDPLFAAVTRDTLDYVLRDLCHADGGFFSAEDADSPLAPDDPAHREGAFYVWTKAEIDALLPPADAKIFNRHYGIEPAGNASAESDPHGELAGRNILIAQGSVADTATALHATVEDVEVSLAASRRTLFDARAHRPRPHLDDKILTAWNGLMLSAFARAGALFDDAIYRTAAERAAKFLLRELWDGERLYRAWRNGARSPVPEFAEDYAFLIQGLLDLYEAGFDQQWLAWARQLQGLQDATFADGAGAYFGSSGADPLVPLRTRTDHDGAEPSASSISASNLIRLARMLHDDTLAHRARAVLTAFSPILQNLPAAAPQMLAALDTFLAPARQIVIAGPPADDRTRALAAAARRPFDPRRVLILADDAEGQRLLATASEAITAMQPINGQPAAYICDNFTCQAPITDPSKIPF